MKLLLMAPLNMLMYEGETRQVDRLSEKISDIMKINTDKHNIRQHIEHMNNLVKAIQELSNYLAKFIGKRLI